MRACEKLKVFFKGRIILKKKPLATQISRSNACRLLSLTPFEWQCLQKYSPHNQTTQRRYTPRDSNSQRRKMFQNLKKRIQVCLDVKGDQFQYRL
jgi:hypothetical protein